MGKGREKAPDVLDNQGGEFSRRVTLWPFGRSKLSAPTISRHRAERTQSRQRTESPMHADPIGDFRETKLIFQSNPMAVCSGPRTNPAAKMDNRGKSRPPSPFSPSCDQEASKKRSPPAPNEPGRDKTNPLVVWELPVGRAVPGEMMLYVAGRLEHKRTQRRRTNPHVPQQGQPTPSKFMQARRHQ